MKLISYKCTEDYALGVARNLDTSLSASDKNHPELLHRANTAVEINTRLTTFISILLAGLSTVIITVNNNRTIVGVVIGTIIFFGLYVFYLKDISHSQRAYFSDKKISPKILWIMIFLDIVLLATSYFTAPTI